MATIIWQGDGVPVAQKSTSTVSGVWATNDTISFLLNGKSFVVTIGSLVTTDQVAATIVESINGSVITDSTASVSISATSIVEFTEFTASSESSVVTITADTAGKPFGNPTVSATTAGTGDATSFSATTQNEGANVFSTAENWSGNTVPVGGDTIVFESGSIDLLYDLDQSSLSSAVSVEVKQGYSGRIGLPKTNTDGTSYEEYRDTYLIVPASSLKVGDGSGVGSQRIKIDASGENSSIFIKNSGSSAEQGVPSILIKGTGITSSLSVSRGSVGVCFYSGESGTVKTLKVGFVSSVSGDSSVKVGSGCTLSGAGFSIDQIGGTLDIDSSTTSIKIQNGGLLINSSAHASIIVDSGKCFYNSSGDITFFEVGDSGAIDFSLDMQSRIVTNATLHKGASLIDPAGTATFSNPIQVIRAGLSDLKTIDLGKNIKITAVPI